MKTAYLVYKPIIDYEDSIEPYCICLNEKSAKSVEKKIIDWYNEIIENLPEEPEEEKCWMDTEEEAAQKKLIYDDLWIAAHDKSEKIKEKFYKNKPFENIMTYEIPTFKHSYNSPENWVSLMVLDIFP